MLAPGYLAGWKVCVVSQWTTLSYYTLECFPHTALMHCVLLGWYHHVIAVIWLHPFPVTSASNAKYSSTMLHCCIDLWLSQLLCTHLSAEFLLFGQCLSWDVKCLPSLPCGISLDVYTMLALLPDAYTMLLFCYIDRCLHHSALLLLSGCSVCRSLLCLYSIANESYLYL